MDINKLKPGDIGLFKGKAWVSKQIMKAMNIYRKKKGLPKRELYSHAFMVVNVWNKIYVAEAQANGIVVKPFDETYAKNMDRVKMLTPIKPYTAAEQKKVSKIAVDNSLTPTRYDYFGLLWQLKMVLSPLTRKKKKDWDGPTGDKATKRMYCTEAVATWANKVRENTFDMQYSINPLDVDLNPNYKQKVI